MSMESNDPSKQRVNIHPGLLVEIISREDRSGNDPIRGIVANILTHSATHPHGIMVELEDGRIGRIQRILSKAENFPINTLSSFNVQPIPPLLKDPQNNSDSVQKYLIERGGAYCDDCLSVALSIYPRQTINQICRKLESRGIVSRHQGVCKSCNKNKIVNYTGTPQLPSQKMGDIVEIVKYGENEFVEFKSSALWSKNLTDLQIKDPTASREVKVFGKDASKVIIAKAISGFLNTQGGHLIIGVKENKTKNPDEVIGIESEFGKLEDSCTDGYRRMIVDSIIRKYFHPDIYNHFSDYIKITFPEIEGKIICWIKIVKSDVPAFVAIQKKDYFFIRLDAETRELGGKEMVEYCSKRFY